MTIKYCLPVSTLVMMVAQYRTLLSIGVLARLGTIRRNGTTLTMEHTTIDTRRNVKGSKPTNIYSKVQPNVRSQAAVLSTIQEPPIQRRPRQRTLTTFTSRPFPQEPPIQRPPRQRTLTTLTSRPLPTLVATLLSRPIQFSTTTRGIAIFSHLLH